MMDASTGSLLALVGVVVAALVWFMKTVTSTTIPKIVGDHEEAMSQVVTDHLTESKEARKDFLNEINQSRDHCAEHRSREMQTTLASFLQVQEEREKDMRAQLAELNKKNGIDPRT